MSQYGALGMAQNGKSAEQILEHFYTGAHLRSWNMPDRVRVGLLQYRSSIGLSSTGGDVAFKLAGSNTTIARGPASATWRVEPGGTGGFRIYKNGDLIRRDGRTSFGSTSRPLLAVYERYGSVVDVYDKAYDYGHGVLEFGTYSTSSCGSGYCLRLVASMSMNKYLYGLGEIPAWWPQAALRAQIVAARTYAIRRIRTSGQHRYPCDCALYDTAVDQVYSAEGHRALAGSNYDDWKSAVTGTSGKVMVYGGEPITALYHSSSGGHTEDNEDVWGGAPVPYLRGVPDPGDKVEGNPNHRWRVTMSWSAFESKLNAAYGIGSLRRVRLLKPFGVSGRVTPVKDADSGGARVVGSAKSVRVSGYSLKGVFGLKDSWFRFEVVWAVGDVFKTRYDNLNGAPGRATSKAYDVPRRSAVTRGRAQDFRKGRLTYNRAEDKVVYQQGPVLRRYDAMGRERSSLGMPTGDVWGPGRFLVGGYNKGLIVWSKTEGGHPVLDSFADRYRSLGGPKGNLGLPTNSRKQANSLPGTGKKQRFTKGALYLNPREDRVYGLWGGIADRYRSMGEAAGRCGYPTSHVRPMDGHARALFENGAIKLFPDTGIEVHCPTP